MALTEGRSSDQVISIPSMKHSRSQSNSNSNSNNNDSSSDPTAGSEDGTTTTTPVDDEEVLLVHNDNDNDNDNDNGNNSIHRNNNNISNDSDANHRFGSDHGSPFLLPDIEEDSGAEYDSEAEDDSATYSSITSRMSQPFVQFAPSIPMMDPNKRQHGMPVVNEMIEGSLSELGFHYLNVENKPDLIACVNSINVDAQSESPHMESLQPPISPQVSQNGSSSRSGRTGSSARKSRVNINILPGIMGSKSSSSSNSHENDEPPIVPSVVKQGRSMSLTQPSTIHEQIHSSPTDGAPTDPTQAQSYVDTSSSFANYPADARTIMPPTTHSLALLAGNYVPKTNATPSVHSQTSDTERSQYTVNSARPSNSQGAPRRKVSIAKMLRPNQVQAAYDEDSLSVMFVPDEESHHSVQSIRSSRSAANQSVISQSILSQSGMSQSVLSQSAMSHSGFSQSAMSQSGFSQSNMSQLNMSQSVPKDSYNHHGQSSMRRMPSQRFRPSGPPAPAPAPAPPKKENARKARLTKLLLGNHVQADFDIDEAIATGAVRKVSSHSSQEGGSYHEEVLPLEVELDGGGIDGNMSSQRGQPHRGSMDAGRPSTARNEQRGPIRGPSRPPYQQGDSPYQQGGYPYQQGGPTYQHGGPPYHQGGPPYQQRGPPYQQQGGPPYQQQGGPPYQQQGGPPYQQQSEHPYQQQGGPPYQQQSEHPYQQQSEPPYQQQRGPPYQQQRGPPYQQQNGPPYQQQNGPPYQQHSGPPYQHQSGSQYQHQSGPPYQQGGPYQHHSQQPYPKGPPQQYMQGGHSQQYQQNSTYQQGEPSQQYQQGPPQQHFPGGPHYQQGEPPQTYPPQQGPPLARLAPSQEGYEGPPSQQLSTRGGPVYIPPATPQQYPQGSLPQQYQNPHPPQSPHPGQFQGSGGILRKGAPESPLTPDPTLIEQTTILPQQDYQGELHNLNVPPQPPHQQGGRPSHMYSQGGGPPPRQYQGQTHQHYPPPSPGGSALLRENSINSNQNELDSHTAPPMMNRSFSRGGYVGGGPPHQQYQQGVPPQYQDVPPQRYHQQDSGAMYVDPDTSANFNFAGDAIVSRSEDGSESQQDETKKKFKGLKSLFGRKDEDPALSEQRKAARIEAHRLKYADYK